MPGFSGTILLPGETGSGLHATAYVEPERLTLSCAAGQLGVWSLSEVSVERVDSGRFVFHMEGEEVVFLPEEPEGFARLPWVPERAEPESGNGPPQGSREAAPPPEPAPAASVENPVDPFAGEIRLAEPQREEIESPPEDPVAPGEETERSDAPSEAITAVVEPAPAAAEPSPAAAEPAPEDPEPVSGEPVRERSLISESAATIGLVVLLAVLGAAGAAVLFGAWSPFGGGEAPPPAAATALPARTSGDFGMTADELRREWNRAARRIGSDLRIPVLAVETRPEGQAFRYSFGTHAIVTGVVDPSSRAVRQVSVVGGAENAFEAIELVEAWHVLLTTVDETLDEAARVRILHELGAFSSSADSGTVVFDGRRYTFVDSPVVGAWLTVTPAD